MSTSAAIETTLLGGKLKLRQLRAGHRSGTDAVLLSALIGKTDGTIVDLGAGAGAAGLALASRNPSCRLILAEIEPQLASIAEENARLNGIEDRTRVAVADILQPGARKDAGLQDNCADVLITNPPYQDEASSRVSPDPLKARAHALMSDGPNRAGAFDRWMRACAALLRPGGVFAMIHRADALDSVVSGCRGRFGALQIVPVYSKASRPAIRVLVRGVAGSRGPLSLRPGLILHQADGAFSKKAAAIHSGTAALFD